MRGRRIADTRDEGVRLDEREAAADVTNVPIHFRLPAIWVTSCVTSSNGVPLTDKLSPKVASLFRSRLVSQLKQSRLSREAVDHHADVVGDRRREAAEVERRAEIRALTASQRRGSSSRSA